MRSMIEEARLQDLMFIHGSKRDRCSMRLLSGNGVDFADETIIDLERFNVVQLGILLC
jgi:hypothetical protein